VSEEGWTYQEIGEEVEASRGVLKRVQDQVAFDLAPPEWEQERQKLKNRRALFRKVSQVAALWLILMVGLLVWGRVKENEVRQLETQVANRSGVVAEVGEMGAQLRSLAAFTDRSSSALEVLWWLSRALPGTGDEMDVTELKFEKERGVNFSGQTRGDQNSFLLFVDRLSEVNDLEIEEHTEREDNRGFRSFSVVTRWQWVPPSGETL